MTPSHRFGGILQGLMDISGLQVRVGPENFPFCHPVGYHSDDGGHRDTQPADARYPIHLLYRPLADVWTVYDNAGNLSLPDARGNRRAERMMQSQELTPKDPEATKQPADE